MRLVRARFWVEAALAALSGLLLLVTLIWHDWIEIVFGVEPDGGNGALERGLVCAVLLVFLAFAGLARAEWRRAFAA